MSISLSFELADVLKELANTRHEDVSGLIEILLRESPIVAHGIQAHREQAIRAVARPPDY